MNPNDPNILLVEFVVRSLGDIRERFVFVGGSATGLLITGKVSASTEQLSFSVR